MTTRIALLLIFAASCAFGQSKIQPLPHFTKIVASPHVNVVLRKGDREDISLSYSEVDPGKFNFRVTGRTLKLYLDHARVVEKNETVCVDGLCDRRGIYRNSSVTAYVTYVELKSIEVRGEQEISCLDEIRTEKLKLRAYGESEVDLALVHARKLKASLYGKNFVEIRSGEVEREVYRSFGENRIDARGLKSTHASARIYGEGRFKVNASDEVTLHAFGEPDLWVEGTAHISRGIIIGKASIH